jgi:hypothetical protein
VKLGLLLHDDCVPEYGADFSLGEEVGRGWRKLYSEGFHGLYSSRNTGSIIKRGRMRQAGSVALMEKKRNAYRLSTRNIRLLFNW